MYYEILFDREQQYAERAERQEIEREQIEAGTHYYDRNTGTVREKVPGCCQQCDDHDKQQHCDLCGEPKDADECESYPTDAGEVMACHPCIEKGERAKLDEAAEQDDDTPMHLQLGELPHGGWRRS